MITILTPNKPVIDEWCSRLESGEYKRGEYFLRHGDTFSAWGIACEMGLTYGIIKNRTHGQADVNAGNVDIPGIVYYGVLANAYEYDECLASPPDALTEWIGVDPLELIEHDGAYYTISSLSDRFSFDVVTHHLRRMIK